MTSLTWDFLQCLFIFRKSQSWKKNAPATQPKLTYDLIEADKLESKLFQVGYNSLEDCLSLASSLSSLPAYTLIKDLVSVHLEEDSPGSHINVSFLLAQLWFRLGKLDDAAEAFLIFQAGNPYETDYYQSMGKYMDLLASGRTTAEARRMRSRMGPEW